MRHLDLCSGIGGFALAASWVWPDHEIAAFVEIDDYCQKVLRKHWPHAPIHDDLETYDARPLRGTIDLCTGGYPCQPFSHAGKRKGEEDDRHLWPEVRRVVEECRPRWCLFENVAGHVSMGLDSVLSDLEGLGYSCEATVIPACAVDAPHRRDRVWILSHTVDSVSKTGAERTGRAARSNTDRRSARPVMADAEREPTELQRGPGAISGARRAHEGKAPKRERCGHAAGSGGQAMAHTYSGDGFGRGGSVQVGRVGFAQEDERDGITGRTQWCPEPGVGRVAHGVPKRVDRLGGLGNAIVPQVAAEIMRAMKQAEEA